MKFGKPGADEYFVMEPDSITLYKKDKPVIKITHEKMYHWQDNKWINMTEQMEKEIKGAIECGFLKKVEVEE